MTNKKLATSEGAYLAWVEGVHLPEPESKLPGFVVLDLLHPSELALIRSGELDFRSLVERPVEKGLKTLPLILPFDQMTPAWRVQVQRASGRRRKLYVWLKQRPEEGGGSQELQDGQGIGRAVLAISGWDQEGRADEAVFIDRIATAAPGDSRPVSKAFRSESFLASLSAAPSTPGKKKASRRRFLRDILEHPTWHVSHAAVGVYDVGQGSASALVDEAEHPRVFFDIGKPLGFFKHTLPAHRPDFFLCDARKSDLDDRWCHAPVVLSHWDFDHWTGVLKSAYVYSLPDGTKAASITLIDHALERYWIAPNQEHLDLSPTHLEFIRLLAKSVNGASGQRALQYWPKTLPRLPFTHGVIVKAEPDSSAGNDIAARRNNSGLVMLLTLPGVRQTTPQPWLLLPGDARIESIPVDFSGLQLVGMVVSHHGGVLGGVPSASPWPSLSGPVTPNPNVVCSVGRPNSVGDKPYGHPDPTALARHTASNWDPVTFTFNSNVPASSKLSLGNYCLSLSNHQPECGCRCVELSNLSLNRIPGT